MPNGGYQGWCFYMGNCKSWMRAYMGSCDWCGSGGGWVDVDLGAVI